MCSSSLQIGTSFGAAIGWTSASSVALVDSDGKDMRYSTIDVEHLDERKTTFALSPNVRLPATALQVLVQTSLQQNEGIAGVGIRFVAVDPEARWIAPASASGALLEANGLVRRDGSPQPRPKMPDDEPGASFDVTGSDHFISMTLLDAKGHIGGMRFSDVRRPGWGPVVSGWSFVSPDDRRIIQEDFAWHWENDWYALHRGDLVLRDATNARPLTSWRNAHLIGLSRNGELLAISRDGKHIEIVRADDARTSVLMEADDRAQAAAASEDGRHWLLLVESQAGTRVCVSRVNQSK